MEFLFELSKITKDYKLRDGIVRALDNVSIEIPHGAIALLGPNGSGKTTLIKLLLKLIHPTKGHISAFGNYEYTQSDLISKIGYFPETSSIITKVNAIKYIRNFAMLSGLSYNKAMQRTHEVLDYVGLGDERYRLIEKYSTGMKQRLLFAQSLVHDPEIIIMDEPTSGLSPEGREDMLGLIKEIHENYGKSILFSTHILKDIEDICKYVIIMNKGKVIFKGESDDINKLNKHSIEIYVNNNIDKFIDLLENKNYKVEHRGSSIRVHGDIDLLTINNLAIESDTVLHGFKQHEIDLEDLFLNLISDDIDR